MMKIFKHMQEAAKRREPVRVGRAMVKYSEEPFNAAMAESANLRRDYTLSFGCSLVGPEEASDHLAERAKRMIAREIYGEIEGDIRDAIEAAHEETYRAPDDPLMGILEGMLRKVRGE